MAVETSRSSDASERGDPWHRKARACLAFILIVGLPFGAAWLLDRQLDIAYRAFDRERRQTSALMDAPYLALLAEFNNRLARQRSRHGAVAETPVPADDPLVTFTPVEVDGLDLEKFMSERMGTGESMTPVPESVLQVDTPKFVRAALKAEQRRVAELRQRAEEFRSFINEGMTNLGHWNEAKESRRRPRSRDWRVPAHRDIIPDAARDRISALVKALSVRPSLTCRGDDRRPTGPLSAPEQACSTRIGGTAADISPDRWLHHDCFDNAHLYLDETYHTRNNGRGGTKRSLEEEVNRTFTRNGFRYNFYFATFIGENDVRVTDIKRKNWGPGRAISSTNCSYYDAFATVLAEDFRDLLNGHGPSVPAGPDRSRFLFDLFDAQLGFAGIDSTRGRVTPLEAALVRIDSGDDVLVYPGRAAEAGMGGLRPDGIAAADKKALFSRQWPPKPSSVIEIDGLADGCRLFYPGYKLDDDDRLLLSIGCLLPDIPVPSAGSATDPDTMDRMQDPEDACSRPNANCMRPGLLIDLAWHKPALSPRSAGTALEVAGGGESGAISETADAFSVTIPPVGSRPRYLERNALFGAAGVFAVLLFVGYWQPKGSRLKVRTRLGYAIYADSNDPITFKKATSTEYHMTYVWELGFLLSLPKKLMSAMARWQGKQSASDSFGTSQEKKWEIDLDEDPRFIGGEVWAVDVERQTVVSLLGTDLVFPLGYSRYQVTAEYERERVKFETGGLRGLFPDDAAHALDRDVVGRISRSMVAGRPCRMTAEGPRRGHGQAASSLYHLDRSDSGDSLVHGRFAVKTERPSVAVRTMLPGDDALYGIVDVEMLSAVFERAGSEAERIRFIKGLPLSRLRGRVLFAARDADKIEELCRGYSLEMARARQLLQGDEGVIGPQATSGFRVFPADLEAHRPTHPAVLFANGADRSLTVHVSASWGHAKIATACRISQAPADARYSEFIFDGLRRMPDIAVDDWLEQATARS